MFCERCKKEVETITKLEGPHSKNYARIECKECGRWIDWKRKPKNEGKRRRTTKIKISQLGITECELCGRKKSELGINECFEIHHKLPVSEGGKDVISNVMVVCTACHGMIHWLRLYINLHFRGDKNV